MKKKIIDVVGFVRNRSRVVSRRNARWTRSVRATGTFFPSFPPVLLIAGLIMQAGNIRVRVYVPLDSARRRGGADATAASEPRARARGVARAAQFGAGSSGVASGVHFLHLNEAL